MSVRFSLKHPVVSAKAALSQEETISNSDGNKFVEMVSYLENKARSQTKESPFWVESRMFRISRSDKSLNKQSKKHVAKRIAAEAYKELHAAGFLPGFWAIAQWAFIAIMKRLILNWILDQLEEET